MNVILAISMTSNIFLAIYLWTHREEQPMYTIRLDTRDEEDSITHYEYNYSSMKDALEAKIQLAEVYDVEVDIVVR